MNATQETAEKLSFFHMVKNPSVFEEKTTFIPNETGYWANQFTFVEPQYGKPSISEIARRIRSYGVNQSREFHNFVERVLGGNETKLRVKPVNSIINKLNRYRRNETRIKFEDMVGFITDLAGARAITNGSQESTDAIIKNLVKEIMCGNVTVTRIKNHAGRGITPYLSKKNIADIKNAVTIKRKPLPRLIEKHKNSGYTAAHIVGKTKNGLNFEIQIKGKEVNDMDFGTHITHDLLLRKDIIQNREDRLKDLLPVQQAFYSLDKERLQLLHKYQTNCYFARRLKELGENVEDPSVPKGIPEVLAMSNLILLAKKYKL